MIPKVKKKKKSFFETSISLTRSTKSKMRDSPPWTTPSEHSSLRGNPSRMGSPDSVLWTSGAQRRSYFRDRHQTEHSKWYPAQDTTHPSMLNALISWVGKTPWRRERLNTPVSWPGESHGLYSPWRHKESDTTERLSHSQ